MIDGEFAVHRRVSGMWFARGMPSIVSSTGRPAKRPHVRSPHRYRAVGRADVQAGLDWVGRWLLEARRRAGLTQLQLERMSGVDQTTISRLERGRLASLGLDRLAAIIDTFVKLGAL